MIFKNCYIKLFPDLARHLHKICVIGSGPSAFYTAQYLLKKGNDIEIDIFEKLAFPYGLVRYGVAPDHQSAKNVINKFEVLMDDPRLSFFGNIAIGKDVYIKNLLESYDSVVLCYGSFNNQNMNVPGEGLQGVYSAQSFVGWYNGHPDHVKFHPNLNCETAVIVGMGNVSLDIARILLSPIEVLKGTDISETALDVLAHKKLKRIIVTGRRGPMDAAFTIKEFRKITQIPNCRLVLNPKDFEGLEEKNLPRPKLRLKDLYLSQLQKMQSLEHLPSQNILEFRYYLTPKMIYSSERRDIKDNISDASSPVAGILFDRKKSPSKGAEATETDKRILGEEDVPCGMVIKSIGFKGRDLDSTFPLVNDKGIIPNDHGRVLNHEGLYCSGWIKTGSVGDISTTMYDAFDTASSIIDDFQKGPGDPGKGGSKYIKSILAEKNIKVITSQDWKSINQCEIKRGKAMNKLREKIIYVNERLL